MKESYDRHLNVFWNYNGNPHWEDNLTKAFINTLQMSSQEDQISIINHFIEENFLNKNEKYTITYDLQNPYLTTDFIKNQTCKKVLVGFNPNADVWDENLVDIFRKIELDKLDETKLTNENYLKEMVGEYYEKERKEYYIEAIKIRRDKNNSRMDGWIFVYKNEKLYLVIGIESKLWKLDPYQLDNHKEKSLGIKEEKKYIYKKFEDVCNFIKTLNPQKYSIQWQYLDYMEKLGYFINIETINLEDLQYASQNKDYSILQKKWQKYLSNYFSQKNYNKLKESFELREEQVLQNYRINFSKKDFVNIYFNMTYEFGEEINDKSNIFFVGSELGVNNKWYNEKIGELFENKEVFSQLEGIYEKDINSNLSFEVFLRINSCRKYVYTKCDNFQNLEECFKLKSKIKNRDELNKNECLEEIWKNSYLLKKLSMEEFFNKCKEPMNQNDNDIEIIMKKINNWRFGGSKSPYNTMSYIRLIDYIPLEVFKEKNQEEFNEVFHNYLEKHLKGLSVIINSMG